MKRPTQSTSTASRLFLLFMMGLFLWSLSIGSSIYTFSQVSDPEIADAAIVLGAAVYRDRPSPVFRERINHGIELFLAGQVQYLIFTGGLGNRDNIAESEAARAYAIANGVPADRILIETNSVDTLSNLSEAKRIITEMGFDRVLVVSDPMHMKRALAMADDVGLNASASPTTTSRYRSVRSQAIFLIREIYFYSAYILVS